MASPVYIDFGRVRHLLFNPIADTPLSNYDHTPTDTMTSLPFTPPQNKSYLHGKLNSTPRYLYRISGPTSQSLTTPHTIQSSAYHHSTALSSLDIFSWPVPTAAKSIYRHLRGLPFINGLASNIPDNLVSWTSSLLFALQYVFYRHRFLGEALEDIHLAVVDTSMVGERCFIRDMDLIGAFAGVNAGLRSLRFMRRKGHRVFKGRYYFGEYLSQGGLSVQGALAMVSADMIVDAGVYDLVPDFQVARYGWANQVLRLRRDVFGKDVVPGEYPRYAEDAAVRIGYLFPRAFRVPMVVGFLALRRVGDERFYRVMNGFDEDEKRACGPQHTKIVSFVALPEVKEFERLMRVVCEDSGSVHF